MDIFPDNYSLQDKDKIQILENLFQDGVDPIIFTHINGEIINANNKAFDLFAIDSNSFPGLGIYDLHQDPDRFPDFAELTPGAFQQFNSTIIPGNGITPINVEVFLRCYQIAGKPYLQWIYKDITQRIQLDNIRKDITATLVHDLQGPLGNILSSLELVMADIKQNAEAATYEMLEVAFHSSQHLQWLIDSMLDISRLEAGYPLNNLNVIDINSLVDHVYDVQKPEFEQRGVKLIRTIHQDAGTVQAEENILRRILLNLLNNALKYSQQNQDISIGTKPYADGKEILFCITDQGQGVPEQYREVIFEKYQRIENDDYSMGLGLGLAFCRLAVEAHKGRIWVEDAPDGGACFCFTLPHNPPPSGQ